MEYETLERAKTLEALINTSLKNIQHLKTIKSAEEILIVPNDKVVSDAVRVAIHKISGVQPMFYDGKIKDKMIDIAIEQGQSFLNDKQKELDSL